MICVGHINPGPAELNITTAPAEMLAFIFYSETSNNGKYIYL